MKVQLVCVLATTLLFAVAPSPITLGVALVSVVMAVLVAVFAPTPPE